MGRQSFLCLAAAAACCCLALLVQPVHGGRVSAGLVGASGGREDHLLSDELRFNGADQTAIELQQRGVGMKARSSWSSSSSPSTTTPAAGRVRAELRSVPGGPDPLHHHGSPRRPEQEEHTAP